MEQKGVEKGIEKIVRKMAENGMSIKEIANITEIEEKRVTEIAKKLISKSLIRLLLPVASFEPISLTVTKR